MNFNPARVQVQRVGKSWFVTWKPDTFADTEVIEYKILKGDPPCLAWRYAINRAVGIARAREEGHWY